MLGLCCNETYGEMRKYDDRDDNGDNNGNKDRNDNKNSTSGLGYDVLIFNLIMEPWSCK